jgi:polysaccharide export outer membrane protein
VEIKIAERYFSIIGNSGNGLIQIPKEKINIFQALAMAGDIGLYGDKSKIRILRETANGTVIKTFDVRSADIINSEYFYVEPNDVIYVQNLDEQFFSVTNLPGLFSTIVSTFSFGVFIYNLFVPASTQ